MWFWIHNIYQSSCSCHNPKQKKRKRRSHHEMAVTLSCTHGILEIVLFVKDAPRLDLVKLCSYLTTKLSRGQFSLRLRIQINGSKDYLSYLNLEVLFMIVYHIYSSVPETYGSRVQSLCLVLRDECVSTGCQSMNIKLQIKGWDQWFWEVFIPSSESVIFVEAKLLLLGHLEKCLHNSPYIRLWICAQAYVWCRRVKKFKQSWDLYFIYIEHQCFQIASM